MNNPKHTYSTVYLTEFLKWPVAAGISKLIYYLLALRAVLNGPIGWQYWPGFCS